MCFLATLTRLKGLILVPGLLLGLTGCADTRYYWQSVTGHLQLMQAARPVEDWLADPASPPALPKRLKQVQSMRRFAVTELHLPDNASYRRYADLQRRHVVWNVVAAPELSLTLKTWCFPVAGCVGYRGYFAEADAQAQAQELRAQGLEASVYGVPAYSTLGWMNWVGGDPLLNTFVFYPEGEVARLLFHELSHQVLYVPGDTVFNESFATAVERLGGALWLAQQASPEARQAYADFDTRRQQFRALAHRTRDQLTEIYREDSPQARDQSAKKVLKAKAMQDFRAAHAELKAKWGGYSGYDAWVAQANNAAFGAQAAYDELVPGFEALFEREGRDWPAFYDAVRQLSKRAKEERGQYLSKLAEQQHGLPRFARNETTLSR